MDMTIFEDDIKYSGLATAALALAPVLLAIFGILFSMNAHGSNIFPGESARDSQTGAIVLFAAAVFVLIIYGFTLPRRIIVHQSGVRIKHGGFSWNVPFESIKTMRPSRGIFVFWGYGSLTSYNHQIEILKKNGFKIRVCPSRRDEFLQQANAALNSWTRAHPPAGRPRP